MRERPFRYAPIAFRKALPSLRFQYTCYTGFEEIAFSLMTSGLTQSKKLRPEKQSLPQANTNHKTETSLASRLDPASFAEREAKRLWLKRLLQEPALKGTLIESLSRHRLSEKVSLHMPGHKGRLPLLLDMPPVSCLAEDFDATELFGLDDLSYPEGVLKGLEDRVARLYRVKESIISVSGASLALMAAILSVAGRGKEFLTPRNAHRSVVHALVLSGLTPRWYEPDWDSQWNLFQSVNPDTFAQAIETGGSASLAGALVVSPTFAGVASNIEKLAGLAHKHGFPLIVDEAQGAHFLPESAMPPSALLSGADLVAHSFHKTLGALTQTGVVHVASERFTSAEDVRACLRVASTSSPSYVLLASIEAAILFHETRTGLDNLERVAGLAEKLRKELAKKLFVLSEGGACDPLHIMIASPHMSGWKLNDFFAARGIYLETVLGAGCLLLFGTGTRDEDIEPVVRAIADLPDIEPDSTMAVRGKPEPLKQIVPPRQAFFARSELVPAAQAPGRISADCLAPCPPGVPVCIPGALVNGSDLEGLSGLSRKIRVLL